MRSHSAWLWRWLCHTLEQTALALTFPTARAFPLVAAQPQHGEKSQTLSQAPSTARGDAGQEQPVHTTLLYLELLQRGQQHHFHFQGGIRGMEGG